MTAKLVSPYSDLPDDAYWRTGVAARAPLDPGQLYKPKFVLKAKDKIMTAGSCFAQHVGRHLKVAGANVIDTEPLKAPLSDTKANAYGYRLYSARYGNIYTMRQLLQLAQEVQGKWSPVEWIWENNGRYFDAMRPSVEPNGLASSKDVISQRNLHLAAVDRAFSEATVFVFTFGLTEAWEHEESGTVFPTAPGTIAGSFDPNRFVFRNFRFNEIKSDFVAFRKLMKARRKGMRFLITVSPVPLTATASGKHVEVATVYSKSVLRAVCGELSEQFPDVDYFPSYEVITSPANHGAYYMPNRRSVSNFGVETAMKMFLEKNGNAFQHKAEKPSMVKAKPSTRAPAPVKTEDDVICEEALLESFVR